MNGNNVQNAFSVFSFGLNRSDSAPPQEETGEQNKNEKTSVCVLHSFEVFRMPFLRKKSVSEGETVRKTFRGTICGERTMRGCNPLERFITRVFSNENDRDFGHGKYSVSPIRSQSENGIPPFLLDDPLEIPGMPDLNTPPQEILESQASDVAQGIFLGALTKVLQRILKKSFEEK